MRIINKPARSVLALILTVILLGMCEKRGISVEPGIGRASAPVASRVARNVHKGSRVGYAGMNEKQRYSGSSEAAESVPALVRDMLELSISVSLVRRQIRELGSAVETAGRSGSKSKNPKELSRCE